MTRQLCNMMRSSLRVLMLPFCVLALLMGIAEGALAQGWRCPWRTFTTADGLASDTVTAIYQSRDGALWFGTTQGLSRYDGEWKTYTTADGLVHDEVTAVFQDREGDVWVGTRGGVSRYSDEEWVSWNLSNGLTGQDVSALVQFDDGTVWVGTLDGGISFWRDGEWQVFLPSGGDGLGLHELPGDCITAVAQGPQGDLWLGTPEGLVHYDGNEWETYTAAEGLPGNMITAILVAKDGTIWVGTLDGLGRLEAGNDAWRMFLLEDGLAGEHITALVEDSEGLLWVGTTEGVSLYDGQQWHTWTQQDGLASDEVRAVYEDRDGGLWFGTNAGVSYCDVAWRLYTLPQIGGGEGTAQYDITSLARSGDGTLWISTLGGGVIQYRTGRWDIFTSADGLADDHVFAVAEDHQGALWFGTAGGVSRYMAGEWETFTEAIGLPTEVVLSVGVASDGSYWFGTAGGGVVHYVPGVGSQVFTQADGLADDYVRAIAEAGDGAMWFGTSKGASRFDGHSWQTFTSQSTTGGLPGDEVRYIWAARDGPLWLATDRGAACYDGGTWRSYGREDGLPASSVNVIWTEGQAIWLGTTAGLWRHDGRTWQVYTPHHGLPSSHILSILQAAPDTWWIGTIGGGLVRYRPERTRPWGRVVSINDQPVLTSTVALAAGGGSMVASFAGGDVRTSPEQLLYMYKLEGVGEGWEYGRDRFALYHDLVPGDYTLWLMVRDVDFNYSEPYSVVVSIPPRVAGAPQDMSEGVKSASVSSMPMPTATAQDISLPTPVVEPSPTKARVLASRLGAVVTPEPTAVRSVAIASAPKGKGNPSWRYGLVGLPVLAIVGVGYWSYSQWRSRRALVRDFNPYICGPPIHDERMFFGREDILREILQIIHNNNIIIYGERRIGKTTLLYQLGQRLKKLEDPGYAFFPIFVNLQGIPQDSLFLLLGQSVAQQVEDEVGALGLICSSRGREEGPLFSPASSSWQGSGATYSNFDLQEDLTVVVEALQKTTSKAVRLILLVDEADVINTYDQTIQEQLRGMLMGSLAPHIKMVIAGTYISKEWHLQSSPWYNLFSREIMLPPFDEKEVKKLIQQPVEGVYRYEREAIERIVAYSDRKPFETQQLCLHAVREALARKKRCVTTEEVEVALQSSLEERSLEFAQLWEALSSDGRRALRVLMKSMLRTQSGQAEGDSRKALSRLPLSDEDRRLLLEGGVLYRYEKRERLLTPFQEWIRREAL